MTTLAKTKTAALVCAAAGLIMLAVFLAIGALPCFYKKEEEGLTAEEKIN